MTTTGIPTVEIACENSECPATIEVMAGLGMEETFYLAHLVSADTDAHPFTRHRLTPFGRAAAPETKPPA